MNNVTKQEEIEGLQTIVDVLKGGGASPESLYRISEALELYVKLLKWRMKNELH